MSVAIRDDYNMARAYRVALEERDRDPHVGRLRKSLVSKSGRDVIVICVAVIVVLESKNGHCYGCHCQNLRLGISLAAYARSITRCTLKHRIQIKWPTGSGILAVKRYTLCTREREPKIADKWSTGEDTYRSTSPTSLAQADDHTKIKDISYDRRWCILMHPPCRDI